MELIRPALDPRAYLGVIYSLARLPLAFFYFVLLAVGITLSFSLVWVVGVGIPFFLLVLGITWWAVVFERELGAWWFGFQLRPMAISLPPSSGF